MVFIYIYVFFFKYIILRGCKKNNTKNVSKNNLTIKNKNHFRYSRSRQKYIIPKRNGLGGRLFRVVFPGKIVVEIKQGVEAAAATPTTASEASEAAAAEAAASKAAVRVYRRHERVHRRGVRGRSGPRRAQAAAERIHARGGCVGVVPRAGTPPGGIGCGRGGHQRLFAPQQPLQQRVDQRRFQPDAQSDAEPDGVGRVLVGDRRQLIGGIPRRLVGRFLLCGARRCEHAAAVHCQRILQRLASREGARHRGLTSAKPQPTTHLRTKNMTTVYEVIAVCRQNKQKTTTTT